MASLSNIKTLTYLIETTKYTFHQDFLLQVHIIQFLTTLNVIQLLHNLDVNMFLHKNFTPEEILLLHYKHINQETPCTHLFQKINN